MQRLTINIPASCTDTNIEIVINKLKTINIGAKCVNKNLLERKLFVYIPEDATNTHELIWIGLVIGTYIH